MSPIKINNTDYLIQSSGDSKSYVQTPETNKMCKSKFVHICLINSKKNNMNLLSNKSMVKYTKYIKSNMMESTHLDFFSQMMLL